MPSASVYASAVLSPDARAAAARWLDETLGGKPVPPLLIVVGLGDGALLDVLEERAPATKILAIEPDRQMADACGARRDWSQWRARGRLAHLVHPNYAGADEAWRIFPKDTTAYLLMVNPGLDTRHPATGNAARVAQKILYGVRANAKARRQFAPRYLTNVIRNIPAIAHGSDVRALTDGFRGVPAVIAGAGPSLDAAMPELAHVTSRALLISVDTALRPLLHAGIAPHLVVAIDPSTLNARHFQALPDCPDTWLVAESALDRSATARFDRRTFWLRVSKHHPWPWLNARGVDVGQVDVWGSVLTAAVQVAILAGCDPIVLVGADLAFTGGRPYCRSTTYEFDWAWSLSVGRSLEHAWQHHIDATKPRASTDLHGGKTVSSGSLEAFRDWIVSRAKKSGRRVVNATGEGILFGDGVEQNTLASCVSAPIDLPPINVLAARASRPIDGHQIALEIEHARTRLAARELSASPLEEWADFSGEGFDATAVNAALEEAQAALHSTATPSSATEPVIPWAQRTGSEPTRVMTHLPEMMARLRAALEGETRFTEIPASGTLSDADRLTLLMEALGIIGHVRDVLAGQSVKPAQHAPLVDRVPASALYEWPEDARWGVETFEALLGKAWLTMTPGKETFFRAATPHGAGRISAGNACLVLAIEWLRCLLSLTDESRTSSPDVERLLGLASLAMSPVESDGSATKSMLTVAAQVGDQHCVVALPVEVPRAALARVLTGALASQADHPAIAVAIPHSSLAVTMDFSPVPVKQAHRSRRVGSTDLLRPRWFAEPRLQNAVIAYAVEHGVVCSRMNAHETVIARPDGSVATHHVWPRPIVSELPWGDGGAVAWGQGLVTATGSEPSYVMYRRAASVEPTIEELGLKPSLGTWWNDRLYLSHVGSETRPKRAIASWAPGEASRFEIDDLAVYDMHPEGESLVFEPRYAGSDNRLERRRLNESWRWRPGHALEAIALGPHGVSSGRSCGNGWTARAYPEADVVTLTAGEDLTIPLTVYYPFRVAWVGRSLFVSSAQAGLLLFKDLADELDGMRRAA